MEPGEVVLFDLPASLGYVRMLGATVMALFPSATGDPPEASTAYHVQLAVHETFTNIVRHAYAENRNDRVHMSFRREVDRILIDFYDTGRPFDAGEVPGPDLDAEPEHGLGLFLIRELMDDVIYEPTSAGNHWRLVKKL